MVNNNEIYPLLNDKPVIIPVKDNHPKIVVTDGFHFTKPIELIYKGPSYYHFKVVCAIDDMQFFGGFVFLAFFYIFGVFTGFIVLKLLSFLPGLIFLFLFYINKRAFIQIKQDRLSRISHRLR